MCVGSVEGKQRVAAKQSPASRVLSNCRAIFSLKNETFIKTK